ncbi:MAG: type IV secretion system DNA-binding domain-containing protein [Candidatus Peregrinibacteria bacterium]
MKIKFEYLFKFRLFFITLIVLGLSITKSILVDFDFVGLGKWLMGNFPSRQWQLLVDILYIYYSITGGVKMMRKWYHERKAMDLVFIKVLIARADSKLDQEKRVEKDFKEKAAIMAQLFRALSELRDLNFWYSIKAHIWDHEKVSFEMVLKDKKLQFYVVCDEYYEEIIEKQITSFYPSAGIEVSEHPYDFHRDGNFVNGFYLHSQQEDEFPIKTYTEMEDDPLNDITNVLSKMSEDESAVMQIVISPLSDSWREEAEEKAEKLFKREKDFKIPIISDIPLLGDILSFFFAILFGKVKDMPGGSNAPGSSGGDHYIRMLQPREEAIKRMGEKSGQEGFDCSIRILASAQTPDRVEHLLNDMVVGFTVYKDMYANWFENRRIVPNDYWNGQLIYHGFRKRLGKFFFGKTSILVSKELATLYHFPDSKYNKSSVIEWLSYKSLAPPTNMPTEGILLGTNAYRGQETKVYISQYDRSRHMYIIGKSGSGKSALLSWMARQDAKNGAGFCVVDPHGDLIEDVLRFIPKERANDVIVFNPADTDRPMGLNLLEAKTPEQKDRASLDAMQIFIKLFGNEIFGPRIQHYFRNGCLTLMDDEEEGATLIDVPRLFVDDEFQKYKVSKCKNTVVRQFWENEIAKTGDREKQEMIPYFSAKFGPFVTNTTMRNIIGQPHSAFNIRKIMDEGKILLVNLSKGMIGDVNAQLLGLIFVNKISMAAMSRADMLEKDRRDFFLYVDEFQNFATDAFADILSEARKYKLALVMAHQYIAQLQSTQGYEKQSKLKDAVFGNVGTMVTFKVGAEDAEYFAKEYAPDLSDQDILSVANYKAYLKMSINNAPSRPFSLGTMWDETGGSQKVADILKEYSRMKYGRKRSFVDAEIEARLGIVK